MKKNKLRNKLRRFLSLSMAVTLFLAASVVAAQTTGQQSKITISGTVTASGEPVIGAVVAVKGTTTGTITSDKGEYTINATGNDILVFSSIGYISQEISVGRQTKIDVVLEDNVINLESVVVVGYGTRKRSDLTGAVNVMGEQTIRATPAANIAMALQGAGAGVNIQRSGGSTHPGHTPEIRIRGTRSIAAGNDPLLVVDGIPYELSMMNNIAPEDITSVTVLKDASSTAIYGSRGAWRYTCLYQTRCGRYQGCCKL